MPAVAIMSARKIATGRHPQPASFRAAARLTGTLGTRRAPHPRQYLVPAGFARSHAGQQFVAAVGDAGPVPWSAAPQAPQNRVGAFVERATSHPQFGQVIGVGPRQPVDCLLAGTAMQVGAILNWA
jgi:hypothetical protein